METVKIDRFEKVQYPDGSSKGIIDLTDRDNLHPHGRVLLSIETPSEELNEIICDVLFKEINTNADWLKLLDTSRRSK